MLRRAAPRVLTLLLLLTAINIGAAMTTGVVASALRGAGLLLAFAALGSKQWWRYVRHGKATPWRVEHGGSTALFVTDAGRDRTAVVARLRQHGGLKFGDAVRRVDDPARPVWDDLTSGSAERLGAALTAAGATVRVGKRPNPTWARDVTPRDRAAGG